MRIKLNQIQRRLLFNLIAKKSTIKDVSDELNVSRNTLMCYKNGTFLMPEDAFRILLTKISPRTAKCINQNSKQIEDGWGKKLGGITTYTRHSEIFRKGRTERLRRIRENICNITRNFKLNEEISEFLGAFLGDGFTNQYGHVSMTQISGDKRYDKEYHLYLAEILKRQFGLTAKSYENPQTNELRTNIYSKGLFLLLTKRFGFPRGKKAKTANVPNEIMKTKEMTLQAKFIRGVFDTDGSVYFDLRPTYRKRYIRIDLHLRNSKIISQTSEMLKCFGIKHRISEGGNRLQINGSKNVNIFCKEIGFSNQRHLRRLTEENYC